ncbi:ABC transporter substrate-binding protein [Actinokineospora sp. NBRC 105648]|uniref:ABC transporter substrate-binding protein n=1 Tax=Actinokineospora sp. NBRC 105648 TaxID=3032206 RepID=UPI0024A099BB|nr:ABC transporter substrate-binding protein [Actinokineospora sp. NBRC 105648]GLZ40271.1 ABC transporter substrate-binding protein [Actinokineospora sp. NBRC 105648]
MRTRALLPGLSARPLGKHLLATALVAAALTAGCSAVDPAGGGQPGAAATDSDTFGEPAAPDEVKSGGTLVMALSAEPDQLDPTLSRSLYSRYVFNAMCEKLYDVDAQAKIVPQLATALPTASDGGKTVTIPVRTGVKFADGTAFDAAAVKAAIERHLTLAGSGRKSELGPITSVEAPDATTVVIRLAKPFAPLTAALADRAGMVPSPTATAKLGKDFATAPVCVGAFKFGKRVPQNSIDLVRDPNYYDAAKIRLDGLSYRIITDANIRSANLRSGDVQVADTLSASDVPTLRGEKDLTVLQSQSLGYQAVSFNVGNVDGVGKPAKPVDGPLGTKPQVRKAFEYAIDRAGLVKVIFNDLNTVACSPISPKSEFSSPAAQACSPHDPAKAKQLLSEAGVPTPFPVEMITANNPDSLRLAQALQSMVKDGGFDLKIKPVEYASLLDQQDRGDFQLLQLGWSGRVDPDANITNFVGTGGSQNVAGYNDKDLDALLERARQSQDLAERRDLYGQAVTKVQADSPLVYLYRQRNLTGVANSVKGVRVFPDGVIRVAAAGFAK